MNTVKLRLKAELTSPVDCRPLQPAKLCAMDEQSIAEMAINVGGAKHRLGDLFDVTLSAGDQHLQIQDASTHLHYIGAEIDGGRITIDGDVGNYVAYAMKNGEVLVNGNAGNFTGSGQKGGLVHIRGAVGNYAGGAVDTEMQGLKGGTLMITGACGNFLGYKMRRGIIVAHDTVGDHCASNMIAGTIIIGNRCGRYLGLGMRRGTVIFLEKVKLDVPTFNPCGSFSLPILAILRHHLHSINHHVAMRLAKIRKVRKLCGDLGYDGQGEILIAD